ncbi:MAG: glycosyltransferase [Patescibacteria group bacterium]
MKILFVGYLNEYERSFLRYRTLIDSGHQVDGISMTPIDWRSFEPHYSFLARVGWKIKFPLDITSANRQLKEKILQNNYEVIWIEKGLTIKPSTLKIVRKILPEAKLVSCSEDDMFAWHNQSFYYLWGLRYYDMVFTTKIYNLDELKQLGAPKTALVLDSYDSSFHQPLILSEVDQKHFGAEVGFVGGFEPDRANQMLYLAEQGIPVTVWGPGWEKWLHKHPNLIIKNQILHGQDYIKAINATKINLCFLRKINRDEITSRSVEIPACRGFMLAERTPRHQEFFKEGQEVVFFDLPEELLTLVKKYLSADADREKIATAGRERCQNSGYDMKTQLTKMLETISSL